MKEDNFSFQKNVAELLIDLSLFVNKINPNPLVALATIQILENKILNQYILHIEVSVKITSKDVGELYNQLWTFLRELNLFDHPEVIISALEISKFEYIKEIDKISKMQIFSAAKEEWKLDKTNWIVSNMKPMYAKIIKGKKRKTAAVLDLVELQNKEFLITRLFVPEEHRRKGIGTSLLKDVTKDADKECTTLKIEPMPYGEITDEKRKELIAYYKKFDFKYISEKEYMVRNPKCTKNKKL